MESGRATGRYYASHTQTMLPRRKYVHTKRLNVDINHKVD